MEKKLVISKFITELDIDSMKVTDLISLLEMIVEENGRSTYIDVDINYDSHDEIRVYSKREETDFEFEKRLEREERLNEGYKNNRRANYLKLKEEFENEN